MIAQRYDEESIVIKMPIYQMVTNSRYHISHQAIGEQIGIHIATYDVLRMWFYNAEIQPMLIGDAEEIMENELCYIESMLNDQVYVLSDTCKAIDHYDGYPSAEQMAYSIASYTNFTYAEIVDRNSNKITEITL